MGIIRDFNDGRMEGLRSIKYSETGTKSPYVTTEPSALNSLTSFFPDEISRRIDDTSRIAQMLVDKPGLKWIGNQTLLGKEEIARKAREAAQRKDGTGAGNLLAAVGAAAGQVFKIVASTVAQVPVNGTGTHFVRAFKTDTYLQPAGENTASGFAQFFGAGGIEGAPLALNGETIIPDNEGQAEYSPLHPSLIKDRFDNSDITSKFRFRENPNDVKQVSTPVNTNNEENNLFTDTERTTQLIDYRKLDNKGYRSNTYNLDYSSDKIIKEKRVNLGNQGKKRNLTDYTSIDADTIDRINALDVQNEYIVGLGQARDLIKFTFEIITPEKSYYLAFRAFLDQFSDSFAGDWSSTKYIGRAEDFYTYNGFTRQVSLGFKIAAATRFEMDPLYKKITTLASVTAPTYGGSESKFMRGTIARVTVGDYLYNVPGIIDSVEFSWQTDYPWEINMQGPEGKETTMPVVPHLLDCNVNFKPIHDFLPVAGLPQRPGVALIRNNPNKRYQEVTATQLNDPAQGYQPAPAVDLSGTGVGIPAGGL